MRRRTAFTLVELLVVIGIIAVLIGILMPALNRARESARVVQCASNLRQVATAMLMYATSNKGKLLPSAVEPGDTIYPKGLFWSNELVAQRYIHAPTGPILRSDSVFRCPLGFEEPIGSSGFAALTPRDGVNQQYVIQNRPDAQSGVATWYALNSITHEGTNDTSNGALPFKSGGVDAAFAWYNGKSAGVSDKFLRDAKFGRSLSRVKKPSQLVMAFDGNTYNWNNVPGSTGLSARISGRHGKAMNDGKDGMFNCAFFDGHVDHLSTEPYTKAGTGTAALGITKNGGAIFWLHDQ
jgi:prepilin-type N-terminal cleavage/methylation domain-containing protein/prepilin-type processing-associated H-X9-DG protein